MLSLLKPGGVFLFVRSPGADRVILAESGSDDSNFTA
jgi:hypothetical protein